MVRLPPNLLRGLIGGLSIRFPSQGGERRPAVAQARIPVNMNMGVAVAMGVVIGSVIGAASDNLGLWIAVGVAAGAAIGAAATKRRS